MLQRMFLEQQANEITFIASATGTSGTTPTTCNKPTGTIQGDLMIAFMYGDGGNAWTAPSGWTVIQNADQAIMYKVAGASEGSSYSFVSTKTGNRYVAITTYRNAAYDTIGTAVTATTTTVTVPAITLAASGSTVFLFTSATGNVTGWNTPTGFTSLLTNTNPYSYLFYKSNVAAGSTGTVSLTRTGTSATAQSAVLVGIKPA